MVILGGVYFKKTYKIGVAFFYVLPLVSVSPPPSMLHKTHLQSYLDYPDSVGQTHFLVCLYNPNCLDNNNNTNAILPGNLSLEIMPKPYLRAISL